MDGFNWEKVDEKIDRNYNGNKHGLSLGDDGETIVMGMASTTAPREEPEFLGLIILILMEAVGNDSDDNC